MALALLTCGWPHLHSPSSSAVQVAHQCSFVEPYLGLGGGYVQVTRATGIGPVLLLLPTAGTELEAWRPLRGNEDKMRLDFMFEMSCAPSPPSHSLPLLCSPHPSPVTPRNTAKLPSLSTTPYSHRLLSCGRQLRARAPLAQLRQRRVATGNPVEHSEQSDPRARGKRKLRPPYGLGSVA